MAATLTIARQFNGPLDSGNGGYSAGSVAQHLPAPAEVSLRRPVALDTPLQVVADDDGGVRLLDGGELVADGRHAPEFAPAVPEPVDPATAHAAIPGYRGLAAGAFSHCFVCGRARDDSFGVFPSPVAGRGVVASPWTPLAWTAGPDGAVRPEFVWAALDCTASYAPFVERDMGLAMLARLTVRIDGAVRAGIEHVVMGWPIESEGRKHHAGAAVLGADGTLLAAARALLIEPRGAGRE